MIDMCSSSCGTEGMKPTQSSLSSVLQCVTHHQWACACVCVCVSTPRAAVFT